MKDTHIRIHIHIYIYTAYPVPREQSLRGICCFRNSNSIQRTFFLSFFLLDCCSRRLHMLYTNNGFLCFVVKCFAARALTFLRLSVVFRVANIAVLHVYKSDERHRSARKNNYENAFVYLHTNSRRFPRESPHRPPLHRHPPDSLLLCVINWTSVSFAILIRVSKQTFNGSGVYLMMYTFFVYPRPR